MENIEERLRRLEAADCKVCGFTVDNAGPGFQDRFIALLPEAKNLEVLALTQLPPLNEIKDEWRRGQAEKYRREKKIADSPERAAYFYAQTLPRLLNILSRPNNGCPVDAVCRKCMPVFLMEIIFSKLRYIILIGFWHR